jgi:formamidopyrimidine-DNA glycosylase
MPELPEVETVRRHLEPLLLGRRFVSAHLPTDYQKALSGISAKECTTLIYGKTIQSLTRRGKYLILNLEDSHLTFHLRMTGRIFQTEPEEQEKKHITAWFTLSDNSHIYFKDVRKFGRILWSSDLKWLEEKLGVEPLSAEFTPEYLEAKLGEKKQRIKSALLDQSVVAGLGNIYVDEALHLAGLHPEQSCSGISRAKWLKLHSSIVVTIQAAIDLNGTTFQSFYFGEEETSGEFVSQLNVFGRTGKPCKTCHGLVVKTKVAQRGTHYCPVCQPLR